MKLDYRRSVATFYAGPPRDYLAGERQVADLPFETRRLPNQPIMPAEVGGVDVVAAFDTGQYGTLYTSVAAKARLLAEGTLRPSAREAGTYDLRGLSLGGRPVADVDGMDVETTPFPAATPIGLTEGNVLTIGDGFLKRYETVWDYPRGRMVLLRR